MKNNAVILSCKLDRQRNAPGLVVVGADWCGYCRQLKASIPEFDKLVRSREYDRPDGYPVYWVDATNRSDVAEAFGASGFPTVWLVNRQGVMLDKYTGSRMPEQLYNVLSKM